MNTFFSLYSFFFNLKKQSACRYTPHDYKEEQQAEGTTYRQLKPSCLNQKMMR